MEYNITDYNGRFVKIKNAKLYDLNESVIASGYPMDDIYVIISDPTNKDIERAIRLARTERGSGHDNFLSGITINFDILCTHYFLVQFQRYHFAQIVSSQSKMHRLNRIIGNDSDDTFVDTVDPRIIEIVKEYIREYNELCSEPNKKEDANKVFMKALANIPCGMRLWMRVSTNLLQLKNMYLQRKNHKTEDWQEFCEFVQTLPILKDILN